MWTALWLVAVGCTSGSTGTGDAAVNCNGHAELCDRTLDNVTLPGTHNSMSNLDAGWIAANQQHGITRQLDDGIRALMLDTMEWNGEPHLCHGYCELGAQPRDLRRRRRRRLLVPRRRRARLLLGGRSLEAGRGGGKAMSYGGRGGKGGLLLGGRHLRLRRLEPRLSLRERRG